MANAVTKTNEMITKLLEDKETQLRNISIEMNAARAAQDQAEADLKKATESTDLKAYSKAKHAKEEAAAALEMYGARYAQLQHNKYVTESESDKVIDDLLSYEKNREQEFRNALAPFVEGLRDLFTEYRNDVTMAENTISTWTSTIHANYRTFDGSRSQRPRAVHIIPYTGCAEAREVNTFLDALKGLSVSNGN